MNQFELFSLIFYSLDSIWDITHDDALGQYLSSANPFLFDDTASADPDIFSDFCKKITEDTDIEDSYAVAGQYIASLNNKALSDAFTKVNEDDWLQAVNSYLSNPHKC